MAKTNWDDFTPVNDKGESSNSVDWSQFEPVAETPKPGIVRSMADTAVAAGRGVSSGVKMVADSFGANNKVSKAAGKTADFIGDLGSDYSKEQQAIAAQRMKEAEATGSGFEELKAGVQNFADRPIDSVVEGLGSSLPTIAAMALSRGKINPVAAGAGAGAVQGVGAVKGQIHDEVQDQHLQAGATPEIAERQAQQAQAYRGPNTDQLALGAGLGAVAGSTGVEAGVSRILAGSGKSGFIKSIGAGIAKEAPMEFAQGGQEKLAANIASQREGFDVPTMQGVIGQGTMEGLAGGGSGAAVGAVEGLGARRQAERAAAERTLVDPNAGALTKAAATGVLTGANEQKAMEAAAQSAAEQADLEYEKVTLQKGKKELSLAPDAQTDPNGLDFETDDLRAERMAAGLENLRQFGNSEKSVSEQNLPLLQQQVAELRAAGTDYSIIPHNAGGYTVAPTNKLTPWVLERIAALQPKPQRTAPKSETTPAPTGSFSQVNELAELARTEKADVEARRKTARDKYLQTEALRRESEMESIGNRVEAGNKRRGQSGRFAILDSVLADDKIATVADRKKKFAAELRRNGFVNTSPNSEELAHIDRHDQITGAFNSADVEPSAPNEMPADLVPEKKAAPAESAKVGTKSDLPDDLKAIAAKAKTAMHFYDGAKKAGYKVQDEAVRRPLMQAFKEFKKQPNKAASFDQAAHQAATSPTNDLPEPSQAQKEAGNYAKGHVNLHGLGISIENPAGSTRSGVDRSGNKWSNKLKHHYGYIKGTVGADKDHIDTFINGDGDSDKVFIVDQAHPDTGRFDEHKVIFGAQSAEEARSIYQANYAKDWKGGKSISETSVAGFKTWLKDGDTKKPYAAMGNPITLQNQAVAEPAKPQPDRRQDTATRKTVDDMTPEEMRRALLVDDMTGLGNKRAYNEVNKKPYQASIDIDSLKWINDNMGHASGDKLIELMGQALGDENIDAYHLSGDEFAAQFDNEQDGRAALERVRNRLKDAVIEITRPDGTVVSKSGLEFSYGIAPTLEEADGRLAADKAAREARGERAGRGEQPRGISETPAQGQPDHQGATAAEEVTPPVKADSPGLAKLKKAKAVKEAEKASDKAASPGLKKLQDAKAAKEAGKKQIPDMTDAELLLLKDFYTPDHSRAPKIAREIEKRGLNKVAPPPAPVEDAPAPIALEIQIQDFVDGKTDSAPDLPQRDITKEIENAKRRLREAKAAGNDKAAQLAEMDIRNLRQQALADDAPAEQTEPQNIPENIPAEPDLKADVAKAQAQADLMAGLSDLADIFGKNAKLNITQEQEQKLVPVLARIMDAAFRLGYYKFKDAAGFVLKTIREKIGPDVAAQVTLDHLQGAYISMSPKYQDKGVDSKKTVINDFDSIDELVEGETNDSATPTSPPALDQPVDEGQRPEGSETTTRGAKPPRARSGRADDRSVREPRGRAEGTDDGQQDLGDVAGLDAIPAGPDDAVAGSGQSVPNADYRPGIGGLTREGSWFDTAARNLDLIDLAIRIEKENRAATPDEQAQLSKYVGFGASAIRNPLFPIPPSYAKAAEPNRLIWPQYVTDAKFKPLAERIDALPREWQKTILQSSQYAHYTSEGIVRSVWSAMQRLGFTGGKVFEPGMGIGSFSMLMPDAVRKTSKYTGVEFDGPTALIAKLLQPEQNMLHDDFIKRKFPKDFFDVAIGNPPFSQTPILGDPDYAKHGFMLHDFFFAKSMDRVRPGGLLAFVTSKGTMDKQTDKARKYLAARADLVGAIRLPSTAFEDNAGTSVVTDVIFLRKRLPGEAPGGEPWNNVATIDTKDGPTVVNEYFAAHPEMVLGQNRISGNVDDEGRRINSNGRGGEKYTVVSYDKTPAELDAKFAAAIEKLPENVYSVLSQSAESVNKETAKVDFDPSVKREGVIYTAKDGTIMRVEHGVGRPLSESVKMTDKDVAWFQSYVGLRDLVQETRLAQFNDGAWEKALKKLNTAYDKFRKEHGPINAFRTQVRKSTDEDGNPVETESRIFTNRRRYREDYDAAVVTQLETINEAGEIVKAPFLLGRTIGRPVTREIKSIGDALAVSLDAIGTLNLDDVAKRINLSRDEAIEALGNQIYLTPAGQWQLADEYLSGDVVAKLEEAEQAVRINPGLRRNVEALKEAQPEKLGPSQISAKLGSSWVPVEHVNEFAKEIGAGEVTFDTKTETWQVEGGNLRSERKAGAEYGTAKRSPSELLEAALNSRSVKVMETVDKKTVVDEKATTAATEALKKIKQKFKSWVWTDSARASELVESYNKRYNNIAPRKFDGSHLTLPGVSLRFSLHPHQLRAIWRMVQTGNTYLAHAVGAGKTIEMIAGGMEQKRLGLIKKPMYVVPNHMLEQFSNEFMELYPLANIMVADDENFSPERRKAFVASATMNAPDAVIITHDAFQRIGVKEESVGPIRDEILADLEIELSDVAKDSGARVRRGQLEQQIEAVTQRFDRIIGAGGKDSTLKFEDIGVDFVFADEAHVYRKLDFHTAQQIKGIDPNGSKRALDMYVKTRWLEKQRPGRSSVFASGTPVTNTMGELYTIMRFFAAEELDRAGIATFDAWSRMFGEVVPALEPNAAGKYEVVERFARFDNVPELMSRVRQFMDVLTSESLGALVKRPDLKGGKPNLNVVLPSESLDTYMKGELAQRIEQSKKWKPTKDEPNNPDPIVAIITDGRFAAIDPRFFGGKLDADGSSILHTMADKVVESYHATKDNVYLDKNKKPEAIKGGTQIVFYNLGFGEQSQKNRGFNARAAFTKRLTDGGIPRNEIAWFDDANTDAKKEAVFKDMRSGKLKVLIGSAKKMGTGVNVQKRLAVLHYQDPPWFPADVEQPHGRIIRQGNQNSEVAIEWYTTKGTYQSTMWQMVGRKQRFIDQAFTGDKNLRSMDDLGEASLFEQAAAVASGDPRAIQLAGLKQEVERFERLQAAHANEQIQVRSSLRSAEWGVESAQKDIKRFSTAFKAIGERYFAFSTGKVGNFTFDKVGEFGQAIKDTFNDIAKDAMTHPAAGSRREIGSLGDNIKVMMVGMTDDKDKLNGSFKLYVTAGGVNLTVATDVALGANVDAVGLGRRIANQVNTIEASLNEAKRELTRNETDLVRLNKKLGAPFEYQQEMVEKYGELKALEEELRLEGLAKPESAVINADGTAPGEAAPDDLQGNAGDRNLTGTGIDGKLLSQVIQGASTTDILNTIASDSTNPQYREMAQALIAHGVQSSVELGSSEGQRFKVKSIANTTFVAAYSPKRDAVLLFGASNLDQHLIHEFTHAATYKALRKNGIAAGQMKSLYNHVKQTGQLAGQYGMENVDEFVAEAFSNPDFQDKLRALTKMPTGSKFRNAWESFVALVRRVLGMPESMETALDQVLRIGRAVMAENSGNVKAGMMGSASSKGAVTPADLVARYSNLKWEPATDDMLSADLGNGWQAHIHHGDGKAELSITDGNDNEFGSPIEYADLQTAMMSAPGVLARRVTADGVRSGDANANIASMATNDVVGNTQGGRSADGNTSGADPSSSMREKIVPLSEKQFYSRYAQHIDLRGRKDGSAEKNRVSIMENGFESTFVNLFNLFNGTSRGAWESRYEPKAGDIVYLVPKEAQRDKGTSVRRGWKPQPYEVVRVTDPTRPMYEYYKEAIDRFNDALPNESSAPNSDGATLLGSIGGNTFAGATEVLRSGRTLSDATRNVKSLLKSDRKFGLWDRTIGTQFNKATKDADFRRVFDALNQQTDDTAHYAIEAERLAPSVLQRLDSVKDVFKAIGQVGNPHKKDLEAVSKALFANIEGEQGVQQKVFSTDELVNDFKLTPKQVEMYREVRASVDASIDRLAQTTILSMAQSVGMDVSDLKNTSLEEAAQAVKDGTDTGRVGKNIGGMTKNEDLHARIDALVEHADYLKEHGYMPAMRFGQYAVTVTDPKTGEIEYFSMFESQFAANVGAKMAEKQYPGMTVDKSVMNPDQFAMFKGVSPETVELFAKFSDMDQNEAFRDYIALAKSNRSSMKRMLERKGIAGFSEDAGRVLASFITSNARQAALNMNGSEVTAALAAVPKTKGDVQQQAQKLVDYLQNPKEEAQALRGYLFMNFIGGSVASAAVNLTQPVLQTTPYLSQYAGLKTGSIMAAAAKMAATGKIGNAELKAAVDRAAADGLTEPHEIHQLMADASGSVLGTGLRARALTKAWGGFFSMAEAYNRRLTFIAAYQVALNMGPEKLAAKGFKDAYAFASRAIIETQGLYSKANRPNWARGSIGATLFTFKQFSISYIEFLNRLPPQQKAIALGILLLAAGIQGLPFAEDIEDLIDSIGQSMGYNTNSQQALREGAVNLLGPTLGAILTHGLSTQGGIDMQGRLGLGNLIPGSSLFKASETDKGRDALQLAGPIGSVIASFQKAFTKLQSGNITGKTGALAELAPVAIKNMLQGGEMAQTGQYKDSKGRKVMDATPGDAAAKFFGFQPSTVAAESRKISDAFQNVSMVRNVESSIADQWARGIADKDLEQVRQAMAKLRKWNENNPGSKILITPAQLKSRVVQMNSSRQQRFVKTAPKEMRGDVMKDIQ